MTTEQFITLLVQILIWIAMIATFIVYYRQLAAMREATTAQNILSLINFLQTPHTRKSRRIVRKNLKSKPYKSWNDDEKDAASDVCSTYDVAAILILEQKLVPGEPFMKNWGPSIKDCYEILKPHIDEMQKPENLVPTTGMILETYIKLCVEITSTPNKSSSKRLKAAADLYR